MHFKLIGIREKNGKKYELNIILEGGDENFIRNFLMNRGVVIVSLTVFDGNPKDFGNISIRVTHNNSDIQIFIKGNNLIETAYFVCFLGLSPNYINFVDKPIDEQKMQTIIKMTLKKIKTENEKIKQEQETKEKKEQEIYTESAIDQGLKVINKNIIRIEEVLKTGEGIISGPDLRHLENLLDELKKIRLGTNFNKMVALVLQSHELVEKAYNKIYDTYKDQKFPIDENSCINNIDFMSGLYEFNKISEKGIIEPQSLNNYESIYNIFGIWSAFSIFLYKDFINSFKILSFNEIIHIILSMIELMIVIITIIIMITWLIAPLIGTQQSSLYILPALGWGGLLLYLFNNLKLKGGVGEVVVFIIFIIFFFVGLSFLKGTFSV